MSSNEKGKCFERNMHHKNCCYPSRTEIRWYPHPRLISETARNCPKSAKLVVRAQTLAWDCLVVEGRF